MTDKEVKDWFIDKLNSCYPVVNDEFPGSILLYYDKSLVRKIKLCKLNNVEFNLVKIIGSCLFEIDYTNNYLWCDYTEIWSFFEKNYRFNYNNIENFIKTILKEQDINNILKPAKSNWLSYLTFKEQYENTELIPCSIDQLDSFQQLKDNDKMKIPSLVYINRNK